MADESLTETDYDLMAAIIGEEVGARLAVNDFPRDASDRDWLGRIGRLAADSLLRVFEVSRLAPGSGQGEGASHDDGSATT